MDITGKRAGEDYPTPSPPEIEGVEPQQLAGAGIDESTTGSDIAALYIASDGPYDDVYFYVYPYGYLY